MAQPLHPSGPLSRERERARVRARALRQASPDAERLLWRHLRDRRLGGCKFRRQHPVGPFFAEFACVESHLIVELDGGQHVEPEAVQADARRTQVLKAHGFHVLRFDDRQMLTATEAVLSAIHDWLHSNPPHPSPLPLAGEGTETKEPLHG
jgi:adenine-specific DNA-methyltransferase